jgi:hypothetical protein
MMVEIKKPNLLIVEGKDEENVFAKLLEHLHLAEIQTLPIGGKTLLRDQLALLRKESNFKGMVRSIGVVRDADDNSDSAFQSVCDALKDNHLPAPKSPLETTDTVPAITVMILPGGNQRGSLETILMQSVEQDPAMECVRQYFECLEKKKVPEPKAIAKANAHAFLASREAPDKRVGEAAQAGYWPFDSAVFNPVKEFLRQIGGNNV